MVRVDIAPQDRLVGFRVWANEFVEDVRERLQEEQGLPMDRTVLPVYFSTYPEVLKKVCIGFHLFSLF